MHKTIDVMFEKGVFKPLKKVDLPEHSKLKITLLPSNVISPEVVARKQSEALLELAGVGASGLQNISEDHDKYLYGSSKK